MAAPSPLTPDPWTGLRKHTSARIALGRAGGSLPTAEVLKFAMDHAEARDAVHAELDFDALQKALKPAGLVAIRLESAAPDRTTYLQRPDLGRRLSEKSQKLLSRTSLGTPPDVAIIVGDGLSAPAARKGAPALLGHLVPMLKNSGLSLSPAYLVRHARVAVEDEVGAGAGAKLSLILLGERPGLGSADSLGAYLVYDPQPGVRTDAERNCVSNIRPAGLDYPRAAATLHYLITESLRRRLSGVTLKDERGALPGAGSPAANARHLA